MFRGSQVMFPVAIDSSGDVPSGYRPPDSYVAAGIDAPLPDHHRWTSSLGVGDLDGRSGVV
jgi:hypothetical protein